MVHILALKISLIDWLDGILMNALDYLTAQRKTTVRAWQARRAQ